MFMKTKITALPQSTTLFLGKLEKAVSTLCAYDNRISGREGNDCKNEFMINLHESMGLARDRTRHP